MSIVVEVRSLEELAGLDDVWDSLLSRMPQSSFFQSLTWLRSYWQHFGDRQSLRVMLVGDRESILGILPLTIRPLATPTGQLRVLEFAGSERHGWGGAIGPHPGMTMSAVAKFLRRQRANWDVTSFRSIDWNGDQLKSLRRSTQLIGQRFDLAPLAQLHEIQIGSDANASLMLKRQAARQAFVRAGQRVDYQRFRPCTETDSTDTGWDMVELCNAVLKKNGAYQEGGDDRERLFFEDVHVDAVRLGHVDIGTLSINGEPVGFHYGYVWDNRVDELVSNCATPVRELLMQRLIADSTQQGDVAYRYVNESLQVTNPLATSRMIYALETSASTSRRRVVSFGNMRQRVARA